MTWLVRGLAALALATFCSAFSGELPHSPYADIAAATVEIVGLLLLGWYARWSSLWLFAIALLAVTTIHERYLWYDDPRIGGIDDIGPTGIVLALPAAWLLLALGAGVRRHWSTRASIAP